MLIVIEATQPRGKSYRIENTMRHYPFCDRLPSLPNSSNALNVQKLVGISKNALVAQQHQSSHGLINRNCFQSFVSSRDSSLNHHGLSVAHTEAILFH